MDEHELNRLLAEGEPPLRRSREALKNSPTKPTPWEEIAPAHLKPAIVHLRKDFGTKLWQLEMRVECGCYLGLHPHLADHATFKGGFQNLIPPQNRAAWCKAYQNAKESETFKFWTDQFSEGLAELIAAPFRAFLQIALAQQPTLDLEPVMWAKTHVENLLYALEWTLPSKIKSMCDEQVPRADFANEHFLAYCAWVYWRSPKFVRMQPSGRTPYDTETAWEREDAEKTEILLQGLTRTMMDIPRFKLDELAGEAYVALASVPPSEKHAAVGQASRVQAAADTNISLPNIEPRKGTPPWPAKKADLSNHFDHAKLTDRQRECVSMKFEYDMTVTEIADRLGLSRKTVEEHIQAAERRIHRARTIDKAKARKSVHPPKDNS